jgi:predicted amidohydrolase
MVTEAAGNGAQFVLSPEYCLMMDGSGRVMRENALSADGGEPLARLRALAKELGIWLLIGSLTLRTEEERIANRSFLINFLHPSQYIFRIAGTVFYSNSPVESDFSFFLWLFILQLSGILVAMHTSLHKSMQENHVWVVFT